MLNIQKNVELAPLTTFRIGGSSKYFVEVDNAQDLKEALTFAREKGLEYFLLGGGSNVLVSDDGFDGLSIKLKGQNLEYEIEQQGDDLLVKCWGGDFLSNLVGFAAKNVLRGFEDLTGIPGTIGGAIRGNAGAYDLNEIGISKFVHSVEFIDTNSKQLEVRSFSQDECKFGYRDSIFKKEESFVIVGATFILKKGNREEIDSKTKDIIQKRVDQKPKGWVGSSGSFFKNPQVSDTDLLSKYERDTGKKPIVGNLIPVTWLAYEAGLAGKQIGGARISEKNLNFIINTGNATAEDVIILASLIKQKIRSKYAIQLEEEVRYVGF